MVEVDLATRQCALTDRKTVGNDFCLFEGGIDGQAQRRGTVPGNPLGAVVVSVVVVGVESASERGHKNSREFRDQKF